MPHERFDPFSEMFAELPVASEISERLLRPLPANSSALASTPSIDDQLDLEVSAPAASDIMPNGSSEDFKTPKPPSAGVDVPSGSGFSVFRDLLEWSEKVTNSRASILTDREGLLIATNGLMLNAETAQIYGARLAVMLDQIEHFADDATEDKLLCVRVGSFWLSTTQLRLADQQLLILSVIGPEPVQINFNELASERLRRSHTGLS
jgi:hypothetical protein